MLYVYMHLYILFIIYYPECRRFVIKNSKTYKKHELEEASMRNMFQVHFNMQLTSFKE